MLPTYFMYLQKETMWARCWVGYVGRRLFWGCYNGQVTKIRSYQTHTRKQNNKKQKNKTAETENSCSIAVSTWGKPISICEDKVELDHNHFKLSFASSRTNTTLTEKNTFAQSRGWERNSKWLPGKPNVLHLWISFHFEVTSESHKRLVHAISQRILVQVWHERLCISNRTPREVTLQVQLHSENH